VGRRRDVASHPGRDRAAAGAEARRGRGGALGTIGRKCKYFILDHTPILLHAFERPSHGPKQGFGAGCVPTARRELLNELALLLKAFTRSREAPIYHRKIAFPDCHGYPPTNGDASTRKKGNARNSATATTTVAVVRRANDWNVILAPMELTMAADMKLAARRNNDSAHTSGRYEWA
jgi:hypothetical protein